MLQEPGYQSKRTIPLDAKVSEPAPPNMSVPPIAPMYPFPGYVQPTPTQPYQQPATDTIIQRPGCITATALLFFVMAMVSSLGALGALVLLDPAALVLNLGTMVVYGLTGFGLWAMYRWGANLVILFCGTTILQFVGMIIYTMFIIDDFVTDGFAQAIFVVVFAGVVGFISLFLGAVWWWYAKIRRWLLPNNLFPQREKTLYWFALVIFGLGIVAGTAAVPQAFEEQRAEFEQFNRDIENLDRAPEPPVNNSPFGS